MKKHITILALIVALAMNWLSVSAAGLLSIGSRGSEVEQVQQILQDKGYFNHYVTGYYGTITRDAVRQFQKAAGIGVDGIVGPVTRNALYGNTSSHSADDVYWLSRIIHAEAQGESYRGKVAVGSTILNRVKSKEFPNTIYGVIFDTKYGVQYTPTVNGAIYNTPNADSVAAAKEALSGAKPVGQSMYFYNPRKAGSSWIANNRPYYTTIGNHAFHL
ncbi:MAG: cell wall hydrolase [Ruminococcaceae bacterium]|nr:cell wall hydrolase [Oscillospiraceae bacterium]